MAQVNNTTAAVAVPEMWRKEAEFTRDNNLVAAKLVDRKYESDLTKGDTVHVTFIGDLTTEAIVSGTDLTPTANTETQVNIVVDQFNAASVELFDLTSIQSIVDLDSAYRDRISIALAEGIDTDVLAEYTNLTGTSGALAAITYDEVVDAVNYLDGGNVPLDDRALIVNALGMSDLRKIAEFTRYDATGQNNPSRAKNGKNAMVGEIYGIPVHMTNLVADSGTADENMLIHKSALALVMQQEIEMEMHRNPLGSANYLIGRELHGVETVRADHGYRLIRTR